MNKIDAAQKAIKDSGGQTELARHLSSIKELGLTEAKALWRIQKWFYNGIPPEYVMIVSGVSGMACHELRPDIFPVPAESISEASE